MLISSRCSCLALALVVISLIFVTKPKCSEAKPQRILWDTDMDTDDFFGIFYLMKLNTSEFDLQAITLNANAWTNAGHAVNQMYDILYMMNRDDIAIGVGGEGGISEDGSIMADVGGYLPIIEQGVGTSGYCRYRQAIPVGIGGRLDIDSNFGFRKSFLPQGERKYSPLRQPTAQQVLIDTISAGETTVFITGVLTNFAIFLMKNPHLKKNVRHIYIMGGGVRSSNPTGCCPDSSDTSCVPRQCGDRGNIFTDYTSNPYAEFNFFGDPFAAYQVLHSGVPITFVPLDATNTIPISRDFFEAFEKNQKTYEAQYCFKSLKMARDTWFDDQFYTSYFMWDSFMAGVATSIMRKPNNHQGVNEFAEMKFMNITVVTSNEPYGVSDSSNSFFHGLKVPKFNLSRNGVHSGHIQTSLRDPFCLVENGKGKCKDGYTAEATGREAVQVLVAVNAKPSTDNSSLLNREFFQSFLDVLNRPEHSGRFNFTSQFPYFKEILYAPSFKGVTLGRNVVFDMDMSAGDFMALMYLLKVPVEVINLKGILVSPTGWANAATIDVVYDLLHMMGRDDVPVGLGEVFAVNQSEPTFSAVGDCKYQKAIPHGSGGLLDSDTLYGFARSLPRSPRRYTAENSVEFGAPRDTDHPELRQPLALEIWKEIVESLDPGAKISVLTNGPLTNLANIIHSGKNLTSSIEEIIIVGGHISYSHSDKGNVINVPENAYSELNMFLDPLAAKAVIDSELNITIIPLNTQRKVCAFQTIVEKLSSTNKTAESTFVLHLLSRLHYLQRTHPRYQHMDIFLGEIVGAVILASDHSVLKPVFKLKPVQVHATGFESVDGQITIDEKQGKPVRVLEDLNPGVYYDIFAGRLGDEKHTAIVGSFNEQRRRWSKAPSRSQNMSS